MKTNSEHLQQIGKVKGFLLVKNPF